MLRWGLPVQPIVLESVRYFSPFPLTANPYPTKGC
jgi:hypothetical protein